MRRIAFTLWQSCPRRFLLHKHIRRQTCIRHQSAQPQPDPHAYSSTAIHPSALESSPDRRSLHSSLVYLQNALQFDEARVQLALRGLEQTEAPVRIAVVGLMEHARPGRLLRLLFADRGKKETEEWERTLIEPIPAGHGILVRHGDVASLTTPKSMPLSIITLPHPILHQRRKSVEFLIANLTGISGNLDPFSPSLTLGYGRPVVSYPVHNSVVVIEDLESLLSEDVQGLKKTSGQEVRIVVGVNEALVEEKTEVGRKQLLIPLDRAEREFDATRGATTGERDWSLKLIDEIFVTPLQSQSKTVDTIPPHIASLIRSILYTPLPPLPPKPTPAHRELPASAQSLAMELASWSRTAHNELRRELDIGFEAGLKRLKWWKLIWTADDVRSVCEGVIKNHFLIDAEKGVWWLGGRVVGEGYSLPSGASMPTSAPEIESTTTTVAVGDIPTTTKPDETLVKMPQYPSHITTARQRIMSTTLVSLQIQAQHSLYSFLSTSIISSAFSGLLYLSDYTLYASLAPAAFGIVWSARRFQKRWDRTLRKWESEVREEGRQAIAGVEGWVGTCLMGQRKVGGQELEEWEERRNARAECEVFLEDTKRLLDKIAPLPPPSTSFPVDFSVLVGKPL